MGTVQDRAQTNKFRLAMHWLRVSAFSRFQLKKEEFRKPYLMIVLLCKYDRTDQLLFKNFKSYKKKKSWVYNIFFQTHLQSPFFCFPSSVKERYKNYINVIKTYLVHRYPMPDKQIHWTEITLKKNPFCLFILHQRKQIREKYQYGKFSWKNILEWLT